VSVPFDLLMSPTPFAARPRIEPQPVLAPPEQLDEIAALLARSAEPVMLLKSSVGKVSDRAMRLFAVSCCRHVSQFLHGCWQHGMDTAEKYAEGQVSRDELIFRLGYLSRDFEDIESDNGEIYAAKEAVLASLDPSSPFDPTEAAVAASRAMGCYHDNEEAMHAEAIWQIAEFEVFLAEVV
jgi:hypothetical protein